MQYYLLYRAPDVNMAFAVKTLRQACFPPPPPSPFSDKVSLLSLPPQNSVLSHNVPAFSPPLPVLRQNVPASAPLTPHTQVQYSLLYRAPEVNGVLEVCKEFGITPVAYSPLTQGLLTGAGLSREGEGGGVGEGVWGKGKRKEGWRCSCVNTKARAEICIMGREQYLVQSTPSHFCSPFP